MLREDSTGYFACDKCHNVLPQEEMSDHMMCHRLEEGESTAPPQQEVPEDIPRQYSAGMRSQSLEEALAQIERMSRGSEGVQRFLRSEFYSNEALTEAGVEALPKLFYDGRFQHDLTDCNVCMTPFQESEHLIILPCLHYFHADCIGPWLKQKAKCPECRLRV
mmetsp:Transcript_3740/g.7991  ORF Transcript_3740/g.7991 Transcript_3740/m.7991 type:complete len:163 (+) Transcript_3740:249-737(+)